MLSDICDGHISKIFPITHQSIEKIKNRKIPLNTII